MLETKLVLSQVFLMALKKSGIGQKYVNWPPTIQKIL